MAKKKTPPKKAKTEKNKKVASARQAKPVAQKQQASKGKVAAKTAAKAVVKAIKKGMAVAKAVTAKGKSPLKPIAVKSGVAPVAAKSGIRSKAASVPKAAPASKAAPVTAKSVAPVKLVAAPVLKGSKSPSVKIAEKVAAAALKAGATKKVKAVAPAPLPVEFVPEAEIILTNADGKRYCKVGECDELATSDSYCRYHYLLNWKKIQLRKKILAGDKLNRYIEELTARYPDKYLEMIRKDLATDKEFLAALQELEIDEGSDDNEFEDDSKTYVDEIRGVATGGGGGQEEDDY